jgi:HK97 gp10 family phage protein
MSALEVKGLNEAIRNLNDLDGQVKSKIGRDALRDGLLLVNKTVKAATYSTFKRATGAIQAGFGVRVGKALKGTVLAAVVVQYPQSMIGNTPMTKAYRRHHAAKGRSRKPVDLNQVAYWWRFLEFGTGERRTARTPRFSHIRTKRQAKTVEKFLGAKGVGYVGPRPWVRPAFQGTAQGAVDAFTATMRQEIETNVNAMTK